MAFESNRASGWGNPVAADQAVLDEGLKAHMQRVYNWMASGLLLTAIVAFAVAHTGLSEMFYTVARNARGQITTSPTGLGMIAMFAPLAFVLVMSFGLSRISKTTMQGLFWAYAGVMGISMANIFAIYTGASIASTFFATSAMFAGASLYGYMTGRDLTKLGSLLVMALIGMLVAMVVNIFLASGILSLVVSLVGIVVFVGLTAFDTQRIKGDYLEGTYSGDPELMGKVSVMDALGLYLNFVNLFQILLQFMGNRSDD